MRPGRRGNGIILVINGIVAQSSLTHYKRLFLLELTWVLTLGKNSPQIPKQKVYWVSYILARSLGVSTHAATD